MDFTEAVGLSAFLSASGLTLDTFSKQDQGRLLAIEDAILKRMGKAREAKELAASSKITVSGIVEDLDISRGTVYNNEHLKSYIEFARKAQRAMFLDGEEKAARASKENKRLRETLNKMVIRDIEAEQLKHEIDEMRRELIYKDNQISALERKLEEATGCKSRPAKRAGTIISFKGDA